MSLLKCVRSLFLVLLVLSFCVDGLSSCVADLSSCFGCCLGTLIKEKIKTKYYF